MAMFDLEQIYLQLCLQWIELNDAYHRLPLDYLLRLCKKMLYAGR
jgi:hypothetical protein